MKVHMKNIPIVKVITLFLSVNILIGCATGSVIVTGNKRPAISPTEVKIYIDSPKQYETIGIIEASSDVEISRQGAQDRVIEKLKSQAAKLGANGVLLSNTGSQSSGTTGVYSNGFFYADTGTKIVAQGKAIYVVEE